MRSSTCDEQTGSADGFGEVGTMAGSDHDVLPRGDKERGALDLLGPQDRRHRLEVATRPLANAPAEHPQRPVHEEPGDLHLSEAKRSEWKRQHKDGQRSITSRRNAVIP